MNVSLKWSECAGFKMNVRSEWSKCAGFKMPFGCFSLSAFGWDTFDFEQNILGDCFCLWFLSVTFQQAKHLVWLSFPFLFFSSSSCFFSSSCILACIKKKKVSLCNDQC